MSQERHLSEVREAVAVFEDVKTLEDAIEDLESHGFDRAALSLLASEHAVENKLGHAYKRVEELEDDPSVDRIAFISESSIGAAEGAAFSFPLYVAGVAAFGAVVASGGTLGAAIGALAAGAAGGGLVGSGLAKMIGDHHAKYLDDQLEKGGLLLWVRAWTDDQEKKAQELLSKHSAHDVHVHTLHRAGEEHVEHEGVKIEVHSDGSCATEGKHFDTLADAKTFIDQELRTA